MTWIAAAFLIAAFMILAVVLRIPAKAGEALRTSKSAVTIIRDPELDDLQKERAVQAHSRRLFGLFFVLVALTAVALLLPTAIVYGGAVAGLFDFDEALAKTLSWQLLVGATVVGFGAVPLLRSRKS